eukprot:EC096354.1.p3 GENE.EC096354.1~~EC096354.1.p3  ORF type:complete len:112 (+),score=4.45 EC096354.1:233-568(+)
MNQVLLEEVCKTIFDAVQKMYCRNVSEFYRLSYLRHHLHHKLLGDLMNGKMRKNRVILVMMIQKKCLLLTGLHSLYQLLLQVVVVVVVETQVGKKKAANESSSCSVLRTQS